MLLLLVCGTSSFGQENVVQISLASYSVKDVASDDNVDTRSLGIPNVLVGERVYLNAETSELDIAEIHWSLQPEAESHARLSDSSGRGVTFVADVEGQFDVRLRVTTSGRKVHEARLWVNVGRYVGTGSIVDNGNGAQCVNCHDQLVDSWQGTGHATIFQRGIDGLFDRYDESCL